MSDTLPPLPELEHDLPLEQALQRCQFIGRGIIALLREGRASDVEIAIDGIRGLDEELAAIQQRLKPN